jgi:hypothetical protein
MMSGVSLETCWASKKHWNNKFYYTVASCLLFLYNLYYEARIQGISIQFVLWCTDPGYFYTVCIMMHGSRNIKFLKFSLWPFRLWFYILWVRLSCRSMVFIAVRLFNLRNILLHNWVVDIHGSMHHNINLIEITNKMRPCSRIYYSNVT